MIQIVNRAVDEVWKNVVNWESLYEISNLGNVRSITKTITQSNNSVRTFTGKQLVPILDIKGYLRVNLANKGFVKLVQIHRLVVAAFLDSTSKLFVNHKDGNKQNNRLDNLELVTHSENIKHMYQVIGVKANKPMLGRTGKNCVFSKPVWMTNPKDSTFVKLFESGTAAAKAISGNQSKISKAIKTGKLYKGFRFSMATVGTPGETVRKNWQEEDEVD